MKKQQNIISTIEDDDDIRTIRKLDNFLRSNCKTSNSKLQMPEFSISQTKNRPSSSVERYTQKEKINSSIHNDIIYKNMSIIGFVWNHDTTLGTHVYSIKLDNRIPEKVGNFTYTISKNRHGRKFIEYIGI